MESRRHSDAYPARNRAVNKRDNLEAKLSAHTEHDDFPSDFPAFDC